MAGGRDRKDVLDVFAVLSLASGAVHANTLESLRAADRKAGEGKTRRIQRAFADRRRHAGRVPPAVDRMPGYSPQLNGIERVWNVLRRRATHHRMFDAIADLKASARNSLRHFQTVPSRLRTLTHGRPKKVRI